MTKVIIIALAFTMQASIALAIPPGMAPPAPTTIIPPANPAAPTPNQAADQALASSLAKLSIENQANALLSAGLTITSTGTSSLNGTYGADKTSQTNIQALLLGYSLLGTFPHDSATYPYLDIAGTTHTMTQTQMQNVASALQNFVSDVLQAAATARRSGGAAVWPTPLATIP